MKTEHKACISFAPVMRADARVLIVGSMPGVASLDAQQYYAHPRNQFWALMYALFDTPMEHEYAQRLRFLTKNRIALWDSTKACVREGSLDSNMKDIVLNDFSALFAACKDLRMVACNGAKAYELFLRTPQATGISVCKMPSTSPANAANSFESKKQAWKCVADCAKEEL